jgi:hypothetical protein
MTKKYVPIDDPSVEAVKCVKKLDWLKEASSMLALFSVSFDVEVKNGLVIFPVNLDVPELDISCALDENDYIVSHPDGTVSIMSEDDFEASYRAESVEAKPKVVTSPPPSPSPWPREPWVTWESASGLR